MTSLNKAFGPVLFGILFSLQCATPVAFSAFRGQLAEGLWGGEHIRMEVTAAVTNIEFDCGQATISSKILIDPRGRFVAHGTHFEERGPVRLGEEGHSYPVQFRGTVKGRNMKLTVMRTDTKELLGSFSLTRGREPELVKCR